MERKWLSELRKKRNMSQENLANLCDSTQMMISNIENGRRRPSPELAQKLGNILKFEWTIFYEDNSKPQNLMEK